MKKKNVGIIDIECYFPKLYVDQEKLEKYNNVDRGKYIKGLMQEKMAVVDSSEDIVSMCMTALEQLIKSSNIKYSDIGRLSVGTETPIDKSKSIKSYLMDLFGDNNDVEGVDCINACYGGTAALLDSYNWIHSPLWNGKYAVVVTGDIAIYDKGPARPTGGAGVCAMLIGPDAVFNLQMNPVSYFEHAYDFYKPILNSEYPIVDGKFSNECYLRAIDNCYDSFKKKNNIEISDFDYGIFHAPYGKMVYKAYQRLLEKDDNSVNDFEEKLEPGLLISKQ